MHVEADLLASPHVKEFFASVTCLVIPISVFHGTKDLPTAMLAVSPKPTNSTKVSRNSLLPPGSTIVTSALLPSSENRPGAKTILAKRRLVYNCLQGPAGIDFGLIVQISKNTKRQLSDFTLY